jgi:hypothetical protein
MCIFNVPMWLRARFAQMNCDFLLADATFTQQFVPMVKELGAGQRL